MTASRADRLLGTAVLVAGALVLVFGGGFLRHARVESEFHQACRTVAKQDPVSAVFESLGMDGYRPGCGIDLPCKALVLPGHEREVPWLCTAEDCTLVWRKGDSTCFVRLDPGTHRALGPGLLREVPF